MFNDRLVTPRRARTRHRDHAQLPVRRRAARVMAAAATVAITATTVTTAVAGPATAAPTDACPRWTAVLVPGTSETNSSADPTQLVGLLAPLGEQLRARYGNDIDVRSLPYAAAPVPYHESESGGVQALSGMLGGLCATTQVVLAGYSQGADVAGDTAAEIGQGRGTIPASRVHAVGLLSDPNRDPATTQLGQAVDGEGIAGPREDFGAVADTVRTVCAVGDIYCATSAETSPALATVGRAFTGSPALLDDDSSTTGSGSLDPSSVTRQVILVLGSLAEIAANVPAIGDNLLRLPQALAVGDIAGAQHISGELNNLFNPLVSLADEVDLHLVARALSMAAAADPSGWTAVAAQVVDIVADLDLGRIATDIGQAQDIAWRAVAKLTAGDLVGAGIELAGLVPVAADLAATAASALLGDGTSQLTDLAAEVTAGTDPTSSAALSNLADLVRQGGDAAEFYASGVHVTGYDAGVGEVLNWFTTQIDRS